MMDRKSFIQKTGLGMAGFLGGISMTSPADGPSEFSHRNSKNWAWITEAKGTEDEWKHRLEQLKEAGFDAILPQENFEAIIPAAEAHDIEVHAWLVSLQRGSDKRYNRSIPSGLPSTGTGSRR